MGAAEFDRITAAFDAFLTEHAAILTATGP
jgi:hypothetical protein